MYDENPAVLIVGGGLAGLSSAVFLAARDVPVVLVEKHAGTMVHPRARSINPRSVELFDQFGLLPKVREHRSYSSRPGGLLFRGETLAGMEVFRSPLDPPSTVGRVTPQPWAPIDQDKLETVLRERAEELGADIRFATELVSFEQDEEGVTALIRDRVSGAEKTVRAGHLVAADGNRSPVRTALGIGLHGRGLIGSTMTLVFEADLSEPLRGRQLGVCHLDRPVTGTVLLQHDGERRWVFSMPYRPEDGETLADFDDERCVALVREAIGVPDLEVTIVPQLSDGTKVLGYELAARVADRFGEGRVLLVGDSAHVMPPTGAFGASTGLADAHNLAWKLAAVHHKEAGPALLDTYDAERRPVAELTVAQALLQMERRTKTSDGKPGGFGGRPGGPGGKPGPAAVKPAEGGTAPAEDAPAAGGGDASYFKPYEYYSTVLGYCYRSTAVPGADPELPPALPPGELGGRPGTRAPHLPVDRDGAEGSTLDLYGDGFALLVGTGLAGDRWADALETAAARLGVTARSRRLGAAAETGAEVVTREGSWAEAHGVGAGGAVLVRPDGFVAWRAEGPAGTSQQATEEVERVLREVLDR
ncbi:FAD-dependent monooxygenase [Streptomyces hydrogenans]|uniref:FAD-dependent monooxygenase n=1 Tax=Streptomyces hydrogenans TaxID=1873719 RepID=UPI0037FA9F94